MNESVCLSFAGVNPLMFGTASANMSTFHPPASVDTLHDSSRASSRPAVLQDDQCWNLSITVLHRWGKTFPTKTAKNKDLCHDSMAQTCRDHRLLCRQRLAVVLWKATHAQDLAGFHHSTLQPKKTHCEVSTSEPAQEVSLHLTSDNNWICLSQNFLSRFIVPERSAGYPNVLGSRKDLTLIIHKMSPHLCTQKGTLRKHRIRIMFISVQLTSWNREVNKNSLYKWQQYTLFIVSTSKSQVSGELHQNRSKILRK